jgi:hypothetical protein
MTVYMYSIMKLQSSKIKDVEPENIGAALGGHWKFGRSWIKKNFSHRIYIKQSERCSILKKNLLSVESCEFGDSKTLGCSQH